MCKQNACVHIDVPVSCKFILVYGCMVVRACTHASISVGVFLDLCVLICAQLYTCVVTRVLCISFVYLCNYILSAHVSVHVSTDEDMCMCVSHCAPIFFYCLSDSVKLSSYVHVYTAECGSLYTSVHCVFLLTCMFVYLLCMCLSLCMCFLVCPHL